MIKKLLTLIFTLLSLEASAISEQPLRSERLPDLNIARSGHAAFCIGGEVVVVGGHTSGFVPTATAEYFADGQWHLLPTTYTHDQGLWLQTKDGKAIIAGGHEQPLGIGQTFTLELYDPATHTFEGYGCLENKRCFGQALEMDSGHVVISGNWYNDDCIELYDGSRQCRFVKNVAQQRSKPYLLRTARDNAIVFSNYDLHGKPFDSIIVDRLKGDPFTVPLLKEWRPFHHHVSLYCYDGFIGDEKNDDYAYLTHMINAKGQSAIVKIEGEQFKLLPTTDPIPMQSRWGSITYFTHILADRQAGRAYIVGHGNDNDKRFYVLSIDYSHTPAILTLNYTEPQDSVGLGTPILTPEGHLMIVGGCQDNNFTPFASALLLYVGNEKAEAVAEDTASTSFWLWLAGGLCLLVVAGLMIRRRISKKPLPEEDVTPTPPTTAKDIENSVQLMQLISKLMDEQKPYLDSKLKVATIARLLNTNSTYISACINSQRNCSFNQFINIYRIEYAKKQMALFPDRKISEIATASGFSTETSFFRSFKQITGKTPREWSQNNDQNE